MFKFSTKFFVIFGIAVAGLLLTGAYVFAAYNIEKAKLLTYPIGELGNCKNFDACKTYCNKDENIPKCNRFSINNGLLTEEEVKDTERLLSLMDEFGLPGKCQGRVECFSYCESAAHLDECWDYAQRHNLVPPGSDIETIRRLARLAREGVKFPGDCHAQAECEAYCEDLSHLTECVAFAEKSGIVVESDLEVAKKIIQAGVTKTPGGCKGKEKCETYCGMPSHMVECADFGEKIGIMTKDEADMARKIGQSGVTKLPGDCRNKEVCDAYCRAENHFDECVAFAENAGMMSKEEVEFVRSTHGKSPGDCARGAASPEEGKKACARYCAKPENSQACMDFAVQIGLITADDAKELGGGGSLEDFQACLPYIDQEMLKCFDVLGKDIFEKMKAGEMPDDPIAMKEMLKNMKEVRACMNKKTDEEFSKLPPEGLLCLEKEFGEDPLQKIRSGKLSCKDFPGIKEKVNACFAVKLQAQMDECLSVSCADVAACFKKMRSGEKSTESSLHDIDPELKKKIDEKINSCVGAQIKECLAKDCSEIMSCINKLQSESGGEKKEESKLDSSFEQELTAKITSCTMQNQTGGGEHSGSTGAPSADQVQEQTKKQYEEEYKKQYEAEYQKQLQQHQQPSSGVSTPPVPPPSQYPEATDYCPSFAVAPSCSYVGSPDSENYKLCKQCFPDK